MVGDGGRQPPGARFEVEVGRRHHVVLGPRDDRHVPGRRRPGRLLRRRRVPSGVGDVVLPTQDDDVDAVGVHLLEEAGVGQATAFSLSYRRQPMYSIARRISELAAERPDGRAFTFVATDTSEPAFTWPDLRRRSSQLAGALAERGLGLGDRLGIGLRNSPQFLLAAFAAWKLGAIPVPMRWDLPEWELTRLREAIDGKVHLGEEDLEWIDATASRPVPEL